jgi:2-polyprenyl-3-methyl-5-hydroxy-6-metoxy-1,4-benzoquinol methylase
VTEPSPEEIAAGHAFYTKRSLAVYDLAILGYFSRVAWRCPAQRVLDHYNTHMSGNHLDVGVGTGYFLDRSTSPSTPPRLALMDLNPVCLEVAAHRVARHRPEIYEANVLEPVTIDAEQFDSVGMNYLLHCVPGTIRAKAVVFENLKALANPGATVFGATLLHDGVRRNWMARQVMARNNRHGIFSNADDDLVGLEWALAQHLTDTEVSVIGCVGLFSGRVPELANGDDR